MEKTDAVSRWIMLRYAAKYDTDDVRQFIVSIDNLAGIMNHNQSPKTAFRKHEDSLTQVVISARDIANEYEVGWETVIGVSLWKGSKTKIKPQGSVEIEIPETKRVAYQARIDADDLWLSDLIEAEGLPKIKMIAIIQRDDETIFLSKPNRDLLWSDVRKNVLQIVRKREKQKTDRNDRGHMMHRKLNIHSERIAGN